MCTALMQQIYSLLDWSFKTALATFVIGKPWPMGTAIREEYLHIPSFITNQRRLEETWIPCVGISNRVRLVSGYVCFNNSCAH